MTALEKATKLVTRWTSLCLVVGSRRRDIKLIEMIAEVIDQVEQAAYERGYEDGHGGQAIKNHNERSKEMSTENNLIVTLLKLEKEGEISYEEATRILVKEWERLGGKRWSDSVPDEPDEHGG